MTSPLPNDLASQPLLDARDITKVFRYNHKVDVLKNLNLTLTKGEMIAIVGASGTGKSTLMHILGTLDKPTSGKILFNGRDIFTSTSSQLSKFRNRSIGFIFQFHHLLQEFSAIENIMMPGLISGMNKKALLDSAHLLLDQIGLSNRADHKTGELSGGEQQRVAIARALILRPELLLADEPTGNLDPVTGQKIFDLLVEMNEVFHLTTVMVTHNHALAEKMNRCLVLKGGQLQQK